MPIWEPEHIREGPAWLRFVHLVGTAVTVLVVLRLIVGGFDFDRWTNLWFLCLGTLGLLERWWRRRTGAEPEAADPEDATWFV